MHLQEHKQPSVAAILCSKDKREPLKGLSLGWHGWICVFARALLWLCRWMGRVILEAGPTARRLLDRPGQGSSPWITNYHYLHLHIGSSVMPLPSWSCPQALCCDILISHPWLHLAQIFYLPNKIQLIISLPGNARTHPRMLLLSGLTSQGFGDIHFSHCKGKTLFFFCFFFFFFFCLLTEHYIATLNTLSIFPATKCVGVAPTASSSTSVGCPLC